MGASGLKREDLEKLFIKFIEFYRDTCNSGNMTDATRKLMNRQIGKAKKSVLTCKHTELLEILFKNLISGNFYMIDTFARVMSALTHDNALKLWDSTDEEFIKFKSELAIKEQEQREKQEQAKKDQEMIKKAKEQGKTVELVDIGGKIKPVVIEDN